MPDNFTSPARLEFGISVSQAIKKKLIQKSTIDASKPWAATNTSLSYAKPIDALRAHFNHYKQKDSANS